MNDTHGETGKGWYGFDLDGTLAKYDKWEGIDHIGEPVKPMVDLIKRMHAEGKVVKILTARVAPRSAVEYKYREKCNPPEYTETADFSWFPVNAKTWIKNMYLGPTLPAFLSETVVKTLVDTYGLQPITAPEQDMDAILHRS